LDRARKLYDSLQRLEYAVSLFHLEMNAHEREQILDMFSSNILKMLITTDPIKGSQFQHATGIINYDLPINPICYLDRVAKCAKNIKVINFIDENDDHTKSAIETHNKNYMIQMPLNMIDLLQY
jgi:superfamily II DNA/RNA helicase